MNEINDIDIKYLLNSFQFGLFAAKLFKLISTQSKFHVFGRPKFGSFVSYGQVKTFCSCFEGPLMARTL